MTDGSIGGLQRGVEPGAQEEREVGAVMGILRNSEARVRALVGMLWDWTRTLLIAFAVFMVVRTFIVEAFRIPTGSMENTLLVGDFLLVNKAAYGAEVPGTHLHLPAFEEPERGDVVVFVPPHDSTKNYVKRLMGIPGDTLEMRGKVLFVNGQAEAEPYVHYIDRRGDAVHPDMRWQSNHLIASTRRGYHPTRDNWGPLVVPAGEYFMLGDNRDNSEDSRYWGFVSREAFRGKPWFIYYSFDTRAVGRMLWLRHVRWGRIGEAIR